MLYVNSNGIDINILHFYMYSFRMKETVIYYNVKELVTWPSSEIIKHNYMIS